MLLHRLGEIFMANKVSSETNVPPTVPNHIKAIQIEQNKTLTGNYHKIFESAKELNTNIGSATEVSKSLQEITTIIEKMEPSSWNPLSLLATKINGFCSALMNWNKTGKWESSRVLAQNELKEAQEKLELISSAFHLTKTDCDKNIKTFIQTYYEKEGDTITVKKEKNSTDVQKAMENFFQQKTMDDKIIYATKMNQINSSEKNKLTTQTESEKIKKVEESINYEQTKLLDHYFKNGSLINDLSSQEKEVGNLLKEISESDIENQQKESIFKQIRENPEFREWNSLTAGLSSNFKPKKAVGNTFYTFLHNLSEFSDLPPNIKTKIITKAQSGLVQIKERKAVIEKYYTENANNNRSIRSDLSEDQKIVGKLLEDIFQQLDWRDGEKVAKTIRQSKIFPNAKKISEQLHFLRNIQELQSNAEINNLIDNADLSLHKNKFTKNLDTNYQSSDHNNKIPNLKHHLNKILESKIPYKDKKYFLNKLTVDFSHQKTDGKNECILVAEKRLEIIAQSLDSWNSSSEFLPYAAKKFSDPPLRTEKPLKENRSQGYIVNAWYDMRS